MSLTTHTHRALAGAVGAAAMLGLAGCGSAGKAPSADGPAGNELAASSNASSGSGAAEGSTEAGTKIKATHAQKVAADRQAVIAMIRCVEAHGIKVPPQNIHAAQPVFNMKGMVKTPQFHTAYTTCLPKAIGVYKADVRKGE